MKNVILQEFVSVDGFAAAADGNVDFIPASMQGDQPFGQHQVKFMDSVDAILLGRVTYEMFAGYWPNVTSGDDKPFADKINAMSKLVFSKTLKSASWGKWDNATVVKGSASKEVAKLREGSGKGMVIWGSISLAQSLMQDGLVDEYQLFVCPVTLGEGRPLFPGKAEMKLVRTQTFARGAVLLAYNATRSFAAGKKRAR